MRRRALLVLAAAATAIAALPWRVMAAERIPTPRQTRGPFYPVDIPEDKDNDLVRVRGADGIAKGEITLLTGTVTDLGGKPLAGARVEIWQCDANGRYHHPGDGSSMPLDPNFQGYGEFTTGADGTYRFRTIKPVPYPGRTPHIHFQVNAPGMRTLVTQMYIAGFPGNDRDGVLAGIRDPQARESVLVPFAMLPDGSALAARFDLVMSG